MYFSLRIPLSVFQKIAIIQKYANINVCIKCTNFICVKTNGS